MVHESVSRHSYEVKLAVMFFNSFEWMIKTNALNTQKHHVIYCRNGGIGENVSKYAHKAYPVRIVIRKIESYLSIVF